MRSAVGLTILRFSSCAPVYPLNKSAYCQGNHDGLSDEHPFTVGSSGFHLRCRGCDRRRGAKDSLKPNYSSARLKNTRVSDLRRKCRVLVSHDPAECR